MFVFPMLVWLRSPAWDPIENLEKFWNWGLAEGFGGPSLTRIQKMVDAISSVHIFLSILNSTTHYRVPKNRKAFMLIILGVSDVSWVTNKMRGPRNVNDLFM